MKRTDMEGTVGSVVRVVRWLLPLGFRLDPANPPVRRPGWRQERYLSLPMLLAPQFVTSTSPT